MTTQTLKQVFWYTQRQPHKSNQLHEDTTTEILVIGGGIAGLSCAQRLQEVGKEVVLIEKYFCGAGASGKTSGFITPDSEIELSSLLNTYGPQKAKAVWEFVLRAFEGLERTLRDFKSVVTT